MQSLFVNARLRKWPQRIHELRVGAAIIKAFSDRACAKAKPRKSSESVGMQEKDQKF